MKSRAESSIFPLVLSEWGTDILTGDGSAGIVSASNGYAAA